MHDRLTEILETLPNPAIAVSGGVDSMTLAAFASAALRDVLVMHAISPAVPPAATQRVQRMAEAQQWRLVTLDAGEFADPSYRANPVNRCFFCKTNLYASIRRRTDRPILSGANLDDLGEYRPGLDAARLHGVRHPYIEAGMTKRDVRALAHSLGLADVADLPSSPCLSSRMETGIPIDAGTLQFIDRVERLLADELGPDTVRCRVRAASIVIELDAAALARLAPADVQRLERLIAAQAHRPVGLPVAFERYRNGSAFLVEHPTS